MDACCKSIYKATLNWDECVFKYLTENESDWNHVHSVLRGGIGFLFLKDSVSFIANFAQVVSWFVLNLNIHFYSFKIIDKFDMQIKLLCCQLFEMISCISK